MKKMIFITGYIIISCWAQEYVDWRYLLLLGIVIIGLWYWYEATPPQELDYHKGQKKVLLDFECALGDRKNDTEYICRLLKRQSIRRLFYLQDGLRKRISEWKMSGMTPMSLRETHMIDKNISYYEHLLELTKKRLPKKYRR